MLGALPVDLILGLVLGLLDPVLGIVTSLLGGLGGALPV